MLKLWWVSVCVVLVLVVDWEIDWVVYVGVVEIVVVCWVFGQVLLVVVFGVVEFWCVEDFGGDFIVVGCFEFVLEGFVVFESCFQVVGGIGVDFGVVLCVDVVVLVYVLCGVVVFLEDLQNVFMRDFCGILDGEYDFVVFSVVVVDFFVGWIWCEFGGVVDCGCQNVFGFLEFVFSVLEIVYVEEYVF